MNYDTIYEDMFCRIWGLLASFFEGFSNIYLEIIEKQEFVFLD